MDIILGRQPAQALHHHTQAEQLKDSIFYEKGSLHIECDQGCQHNDGLADIGDQLYRILEEGVAQDIQENKVTECLAVKEIEKIVTRRSGTIFQPEQCYFPVKIF
ncbi:hypothetical protein D3C79_812090 [compost metagenome]